MKLAGVVILYNPDEDAVVNNIQSYIDFLDTLIVFDNSNCNSEYILRVKGISSKIVFISNNKNEGIAKPLNKAIHLVADNYTWLLTMDQDSYFDKQNAEIYFSTFRQIFYNSSDVAIVCPNHAAIKEQVANGNAYKEVVRAITSGSIINTNICRQVGGFDEKLFIDDVDLEFGYRCIVNNYKIISFPNVYLTHELGTKRSVKYLYVFKGRPRSFHSPFRVYFIIRNFLYVNKKYNKLLPQELKDRRKGVLVILKNNLFFSGKFLPVLVAAIKGYLHFKMNKFSS